MALAGDFVTVTLDDSGGTARQFADGEITAVDLGLTQKQIDVSGAGHATHKTLNDADRGKLGQTTYLTY